MALAKGFLRTVVAAFKVSSPPLYRYPYRNAMEAFRGDWKHIGGDIESALASFETSRRDEGQDYE